MLAIVTRLRWQQLDPAHHAFDPAIARRVAEPIVRALASTPPAADPKEQEIHTQTAARDLDLALLDAYGTWVAGWDWTRTEGGPGTAWCCAAHSLLPKGESADATVERVVRAVSEWHALLEQLAATQATLRAQATGLSFEDALELAAVRYAAWAVEHTGADDAWYSTFIAAMRWHLEAGGCEDGRLWGAIRAAVSGRFRSWAEPSKTVVAEAAQEIALQVPAALAAPPVPDDALAAWLEQRARPRRFDWPETPRALATDGHRAYIDRHDAARSPERAQRMHAALDVVRAAARKNEPLTWELLRAAMIEALGDPGVDFRRGDAFAHGGRERYALGTDTRAQFEQCLAEANDERTGTPLARAGVAYLDVCFFHPFADGNARAARLALDYVLTRGGLALRVAEPLFALPRSARDPEAAFFMAYLVYLVAGRAPSETPGGRAPARGPTRGR